MAAMASAAWAGVLCLVYVLLQKLGRAGSLQQAHFAEPKPKGGKGSAASPSLRLERALAKGALAHRSTATTAHDGPTIVRDLQCR